MESTNFTFEDAQKLIEEGNLTEKLKKEYKVELRKYGKLLESIKPVEEELIDYCTSDKMKKEERKLEKDVDGKHPPAVKRFNLLNAGGLLTTVALAGLAFLGIQLGGFNPSYWSTPLWLISAVFGLVPGLATGVSNYLISKNRFLKGKSKPSDRALKRAIDKELAVENLQKFVKNNDILSENFDFEKNLTGYKDLPWGIKHKISKLHSQIKDDTRELKSLYEDIYPLTKKGISIKAIEEAKAKKQKELEAKAIKEAEELHDLEKQVAKAELLKRLQKASGVSTSTKGNKGGHYHKNGYKTGTETGAYQPKKNNERGNTITKKNTSSNSTPVSDMASIPVQGKKKNNNNTYSNNSNVQNQNTNKGRK